MNKKIFCDELRLMNISNKEDIEKVSKAPIFLVRKYYRNGLLEKKLMKKRNILKSGKWSKIEHKKFIKAGIKFGPDWRKIKKVIRSRTHAQIRTHCQKYLLKLSKKYQALHKNKNKNVKVLNNLLIEENKITVDYSCFLEDLVILKNFKVYIQNFDISELIKYTPIFTVKKVPKIIDTNNFPKPPSLVDITFSNILDMDNKIKIINFDKLINFIHNRSLLISSNNSEFKSNLEICKIQSFFIEGITPLNYDNYNYFKRTVMINEILIELLADFNLEIFNYEKFIKIYNLLNMNMKQT